MIDQKTKKIMAVALAFSLSGADAVWSSENAFSFFEEELKVITASRRSQPITEAPSSVEVVTADDIRNSGAVNIWDYFRFRAGITVIDGRSGEGNRAIVSVRGFPSQFVDNMLVLVDGRSVYTGLSGGAVWEQIPVQAQDIDRIEIVRGPAAALYGSNAGLGVINIITRKPDSENAFSAAGVFGNRGLHREEISTEDAIGRGGYRVSVSHKEEDSHPLARGGEGNDFLLSNKGNFRGFWTPNKRSTVEIFSGASWDTLGVVDDTNPQGRFRNHFQMLKGSYDFRPWSSVNLLASRRDDKRTFDALASGILPVREYQYDVELTHRLDWAGNRMHTVYGGSVRYTAVESEEIFAGDPHQKNAIQRGFGNQSWRILPYLDLIGALSIEESDTGGTEPAYQGAVVYTPVPDHTFRASHSMAPTIPTLYQKEANQSASPTVRLVGNPNMQPQKLRSYELSYQGAYLERRMRIETNVFYMDLDYLSRTIAQSYVFPLLTLSFDNENNAIARGSEVKWGYQFDSRHSVYANYTYEHISDAKQNVLVSKGTPEHRVNLGGVAKLGSGFSASMNAGYLDGHTLLFPNTGASSDIRPHWRLDARMGYMLPRFKDAEIFVAGQNLLRPRQIVSADGLVVPRTYQAGLRIKFSY